MIFLEKLYAPGSGDEGLWAEIEASELLITSWPDRDRRLQIQFLQNRGRQSIVLRNPEPGLRLQLQEAGYAPPVVQLFTYAPEEKLLSQALCRISAASWPLRILEQPKQEVQGLSLTAGSSVVAASGSETELGIFTAWRSGILRIAGQVTADPSSLRFRLYSKWAEAGAQTHMVGDTGSIHSSERFFEYSARSVAASVFLPVVHAGRLYRLTVEQSSGASLAFDADVYIEPVNLQ